MKETKPSLSRYYVCHYLEFDAQTVHNSTADADTLIVVCVLQMAMEGMEVNVAAITLMCSSF